MKPLLREWLKIPQPWRQFTVSGMAIARREFEPTGSIQPTLSASPFN